MVNWVIGADQVCTCHYAISADICTMVIRNAAFFTEDAVYTAFGGGQWLSWLERRRSAGGSKDSILVKGGQYFS